MSEDEYEYEDYEEGWDKALLEYLIYLQPQ